MPPEAILLEDEATNTGEKIRFSYELLDRMGMIPKTMILLQKPYMERRTYATFKKQWPGAAEIMVASPPIPYEEYFNNDQPKDKIIHIMVGDLQRIMDYPKLGFQIPQPVPHEVSHAFSELGNLGYTKHLIVK